MELPRDTDPIPVTPAQDAYDAALDRLVDTRNISYDDARAELQGTGLEQAMLEEQAPNIAPAGREIPGSTLTDVQAAQVLQLYLDTENAPARAKGRADKLHIGHAAFKISRLGAFDHEARNGELRPMLTKEEAAAALGYLQQQKHTTE